MKCPYCDNEMEKGILQISSNAIHSLDIYAVWYPDKEKKKLFKNNVVPLNKKAEGHYCSECKKVISVFCED